MSRKERLPLAGVIGSPISHSKSPLLHGHWLRRHGLNGYYIPMEIARRDLLEAVKTLPKLGFAGINVTIPHKEMIVELADFITESAARIGSANTITFHNDGKIHADNTDSYGFTENLRQNAPSWRPKDGPAAIIGAGGAARAVIVSLLEAGAPEVRICNRTQSRAEALRIQFGHRVTVYEWAKARNMMKDALTVVNATSLGMTGKQALRIPLENLSPDAVVNDLVYTPLQTDLLRHAEEIGCTVVDGLGMLLHQAVPGFERWFGCRPDVDQELREAMLQ